MSDKETGCYDNDVGQLDGMRVEAALLSRDVSGFELLATPPDYLSKANAIEVDGWKLGKAEPVYLDRDNKWDVQGRSHSFHVHAWDPIDPLLAAYSHTSKVSFLQSALVFSKDWLVRFQAPVIERAPTLELQDRDGMAWYDMGVGQRVYRLAYLMDAATAAGLLNHEALELMARSVLFHLHLLAKDQFFKHHNNHGLYQALGQMAAAKRLDVLPEFAAFRRQAAERLDSMVGKSFFDSGAHTEHSPGYHRMILSTLKGGIAAGLVDTRETREVIHRAVDVERWMVKPDGRYVTFGDTDPAVSRVPQSPNGMKCLQDAGYVFARDGGSYFAQSAGFHSRVHKHADHLSFVWHEAGHDILTDPGRYGYEGMTDPKGELRAKGFYYSAPERIYVERTRAHNCVEIDGEDYARKPARAPFGSALRFCSWKDNHLVTLCEVRHSHQVRHFRLLVWKPANYLIVADWLKSGREEKHDFRQWFKFGPSWDINKDGNRFLGIFGERQLTLTSLVEGPELSNPMRGQREPELQGWVSDAALSLVPAASANLLIPKSSHARFATLITLGSNVKVSNASKLSSSFTNGRFQWATESRTTTVEFSRDSSTNSVELEVS